MNKHKKNILSKNQKNLRRRILEISHKAGYSHLGSCLSCIDIIDIVYEHKQKQEIFVLSNGHAGVALYVVLEKHGFLNEDTIKKLNIHPDRNPKLGIHVSTGSLGQGLPIAIGMALSDRSKNVYCLLSDGECSEGSIWESLRIAGDLNLENLKIIVNANGWGAYDSINIRNLFKRMKAFNLHAVKVNGHDIKAISSTLKIRTSNIPLLMFAMTTGDHFDFLNGQDAHYYVMNDNDFSKAMEELS